MKELYKNTIIDEKQQLEILEQEMMYIFFYGAAFCLILLVPTSPYFIIFINYMNRIRLHIQNKLRNLI